MRGGVLVGSGDAPKKPVAREGPGFPYRMDAVTGREHSWQNLSLRQIQSAQGRNSREARRSAEAKGCCSTGSTFPVNSVPREFSRWPSTEQGPRVMRTLEESNPPLHTAGRCRFRPAGQDSVPDRPSADRLWPVASCDGCCRWWNNCGRCWRRTVRAVRQLRVLATDSGLNARYRLTGYSGETAGYTAQLAREAVRNLVMQYQQSEPDNMMCCC